MNLDLLYKIAVYRQIKKEAEEPKTYSRRGRSAVIEGSRMGGYGALAGMIAGNIVHDNPLVGLIGAGIGAVGGGALGAGLGALMPGTSRRDAMVRTILHEKQNRYLAGGKYGPKMSYTPEERERLKAALHS